MTVAGQRNFPRATGRRVMSPTHFVCGSVVVESRPIRSGAFAAAGSATALRRLRRLRRLRHNRTPARPMLRTTRATRLRLTPSPASRNSAVTLGAP